MKSMSYQSIQFFIIAKERLFFFLLVTNKCLNISVKTFNRITLPSNRLGLTFLKQERHQWKQGVSENTEPVKKKFYVFFCIKNLHLIFLVKDSMWLVLISKPASIIWKQNDTIPKLNKSELTYLFEHNSNVVPSAQISFSHTCNLLVSYHISLHTISWLTKRKFAKYNTSVNFMAYIMSFQFLDVLKFLIYMFSSNIIEI